MSFQFAFLEREQSIISGRIILIQMVKSPGVVNSAGSALCLTLRPISIAIQLRTTFVRCFRPITQEFPILWGESFSHTKKTCLLGRHCGNAVFRPYFAAHRRMLYVRVRFALIV